MPLLLGAGNFCLLCFQTHQVDGKLQLPSVKAMLEELELDKCASLAAARAWTAPQTTGSTQRITEMASRDLKRTVNLGLRTRILGLRVVTAWPRLVEEKLLQLFSWRVSTACPIGVQGAVSLHEILSLV